MSMKTGNLRKFLVQYGFNYFFKQKLTAVQQELFFSLQFISKYVYLQN
jgi:hypothetical protein